jgi:Ca2+-binding EF-hand superfamily protein
MMKKYLLITVALLMGNATYSSADTQNYKTMRFTQIDKNGDGVLTKEEVRGRLLTNFDILDMDGNGSLSAAEFTMHKGKHGNRPTFAQMDKNSDGVLSKDEVGRRLLAKFDKVDSDNNGTLSEAELQMAHKNRQGKAGKGHQRPTFTEMDKNNDGVLSATEFQAGQKHRQHKAGKGRHRPTFAEMDINSDGALSKQEVGKRLLANFDKVDSDNSGTLSEAELQAAHKNRQGKAGKGEQRQNFAQMDKNSDGVLSKDEVGKRLLEKFDTLDSDKNGVLSGDELPRLK